jgi:hypothetical protein
MDLNNSTVSCESLEATKDAGEYNWANLFLGDIDTGLGPPSWGSLDSETVNYGHESRRTRTQE